MPASDLLTRVHGTSLFLVTYLDAHERLLEGIHSTYAFLSAGHPPGDRCVAVVSGLLAFPQTGSMAAWCASDATILYTRICSKRMATAE